MIHNKLGSVLTTFLVFFVYHGFCMEFHDICSQKCSARVLSRKDTEYENCMKICFEPGDFDWPLRNETDCELPVESEMSPACSAENMRVLSNTLNVTEYNAGTTSTREFIVVVWTPCPYGIGDVKGYEVKLLERNMFGYSFCKKVLLSRRLNSHAIERNLSVIFDDQELDYGANYEISVEGLPKTTHRHHAYIIYRSMTCTELNGIGSCQCGLEGFDFLPAAQADIVGYSVNASLKTLNKCFQVHRYKLSLLYAGNSTEVLKTVDLTLHSGATELRHVFESVYPSNPSTGSVLLLQYHAFSKDGTSMVSRPLEISITEWIPKITSVSTDKSRINITWWCAPEYYNITKYEIQLNWYGLHSDDKIKHQTIHDVNKKCSGSLFISKELLSVRPGLYNAQVREWRPESSFYLRSKWSTASSPISVSLKDDKNFINQKDLVTSASILFPLVVIILIVLGILFSIRKGYCKKIHHSLPFSVGRFLDHEESFQHVSKTVWLVWQADYIDTTIGELHAENIRHLAAFMANHCGLNIILDQYEISSSMGYSAWIQEKSKIADITIFICPHRTLPENLAPHANRLGNFSAIFKFYESLLLKEENSPKFATVIFPYSKRSACPASDLLLKTTSVFCLMEEIENLYFFIQGCAKVTRLGRHVVKYINHKDYIQTSEGNALKKGLENVYKLCNSENSVLPSSEQNLSDANTPESDVTSTPLRTGVKTNVIDVVSPKTVNEDILLNKTRRFKPCPPPPVLDDEDADETVFLINTNELLSLQPLTDEAIEPVTCETYCPMFPSTPQHTAAVWRSNCDQLMPNYLA